MDLPLKLVIDELMDSVEPGELARTTRIEDDRGQLGIERIFSQQKLN